MSNSINQVLLESHHLADLEKSGLSRETITEANLRSLSADEVAEIIGFNPTKSGGMAFPYHQPDGTAIDKYIRVKLDDPPIIDGKDARYLCRKNAGNHIYIPPAVRENIADPTKAIFITEGEKKALKAAQEGLCCLSFSGVWCWKSREDSGSSQPLEDLDWINWQNRNVYIIFDSDIEHNPSVQKAEQALARELTDRGAIVRSIRLPEIGESKTGLDDYLKVHPVVDLLNLLQIDPLADNDEEKTDPKRTQASILIELSSSVPLFHDQNNTAFAFIDGQTIALGSKMFGRWLTGEFYKAESKPPGSEALTQAISTLEAKAIFEGQGIHLDNRIARHEGSFWYDLGTGKAVKISPEQWEVVDAPILFRRYSHQKPQATPISGGDPFDIFKFLNVKDDQKLLVLTCIISYFIPDIPHPIFHPHGPHGAGKSSACVVIKKLCDPSKTDIIIFPKDKTELVQVLAHNHVCIFDNMSDLPDWMSDIFCMACTGAGFSKRQLFTDDDDIIYQIRRCIGLSGINLLTVKPDIMDRSILLHLDRIDGNSRMDEQEMWTQFEEAKPNILGGIFDILAKAMEIYPSVHLPYLPRMADFAKWGYAIAEALGVGGHEFLKTYQGNIDNQNDEVIQGNTLAQAVLTFMSDLESWDSTIKDTYDRLAELAKPDKKDPTFPRSGRTLRKQLERIKANLQDFGITYTIGNRTRDGYPISFHKVQDFGSFGSFGTQPLKDNKLSDEPNVNQSEGIVQTLHFDSSPNPLKDNIGELGEANASNFRTSGEQVMAAKSRFDDFPDDVREKLEERAAIMEFDGGMTRDDAELAALILAGEPT